MAVDADGLRSSRSDPLKQQGRLTMGDIMRGVLLAYVIIVGLFGLVCACGALGEGTASARRTAARFFVGVLVPPVGLWLVWRLAFPKPPAPSPTPEMVEAQREVEKTLRSPRARA